MKFVFFLSLTFVWLNVCFCQNGIKYLNLANEAEHLFFTGKFNEAKKIFVHLESKHKFLNPKDYFYLGLIHYYSSDSLNGLKYLKKSALTYCYPTPHLKNQPNRFKFKLPIKDYLILDSIEKIALKSTNTKIHDTINYFLKTDQFCRSSGNVDIVCDLENQNNFLNYLNKNGVPNFYLYGDECFIIFLHVYDKSLLKSYSKILMKEIKARKLYPFYYAMMVDRFRFDLKKSTKYGTYGIPLNKNKLAKKIEKNRKKIGLSIYYEGPCIMP